MDGVKLEGKKLHVQSAKSDTPFPIPAVKPPTTTKKPTHNPNPHYRKSAIRDHQTYSEVSSHRGHPPKMSETLKHPSTTSTENKNPEIPKPTTTPPFLHQIEDSIPDFFTENPTRARIAGSKILGENTLDAWNEISAKEIDEEVALVIEGHRTQENLDIFKRSMFVVAQSSQSSSEILDSILAEGVNCLTVKPMGGILHLITFATVEDKTAMIESKWLDKWFMEIINVNETIASQWRQTIMKIHSVPLTTWNYGNFHKIGSVYGRVISIDYSNYDCAKIMIITDYLFKVNCKLHMKIEGIKYPIFTFEDDGLILPLNKPENGFQGPNSPDKSGDATQQSDDESNSRNISPSPDPLENVSPPLGIPKDALKDSPTKKEETPVCQHDSTVPHAKEISSTVGIPHFQKAVHHSVIPSPQFCCGPTYLQTYHQSSMPLTLGHYSTTIEPKIKKQYLCPHARIRKAH